jgi:hypothetical protein
VRGSGLRYRARNKVGLFRNCRTILCGSTGQRLSGFYPGPSPSETLSGGHYVQKRVSGSLTSASQE